MVVFKTNKPVWLVALGLPFLLFLSCFLITFSAKFRLNNELLSCAILADLLLVAPLIYFLAIRKTTVSRLTVIRVFMAGVLFGSFILKSYSSPFLQVIRFWISPAIEIIIIIIIICKKFYLANKIAKAENRKADFLEHCRNVVARVVGNKKIGYLLASEIAVLYYAFFSSKDKTIDYQTKFTSYKENGLIIVLAAILSLFLVEATGMHFIFSLWNKTVAWVLTALSLYSCIQLFAHARALKSRPIIINADSFEVHNGLAGDAYIDFENIQKIEMSTKIPTGKESVKISLFKGLENHNMVVYLKDPIEVTKIFGITKCADTILFFVDTPREFMNIIKTRLGDNNC